MEHSFTTYVRTKMVFQSRLKDLKSYEYVRVYLYELQKLNVNGKILYKLKEDGQIWYDDKGNFKALRSGPIDPSILDKTKKFCHLKGELTELHRYMKKTLLYVSIDSSEEELPVYFRAFIKFRKDNLDNFFSVDGFSGRVHTPIVNLKGNLRKGLMIKGKKLCSLDVKQMQPLILSKILEQSVGKNSFSDAIANGKDIYMLLLEQNVSLKTRDDAKKFLYRLIFGRPLEDIGDMFAGDTTWVQWINSYKENDEPKNPHGRDRHTNLAWLLQTREVEVMTTVWQSLMEKGILFLTIHDDVLVVRKDKDLVYNVLHQELSKHFKNFDITVNC
jgi:hypothetical protein